MVEDPVEGGLYWTCANYDVSTNTQPRKPWLAAVFQTTSPPKSRVKARLYSKRLGTYSVDERDSAHVKYQDLFESETEALVHYTEKCHEYAVELLEEAVAYVDDEEMIATLKKMANDLGKDYD